MELTKNLLYVERVYEFVIIGLFPIPWHGKRESDPGLNFTPKNTYNDARSREPASVAVLRFPDLVVNGKIALKLFVATKNRHEDVDLLCWLAVM